MAIHFEAVYEHGVLCPLEPLALPEHQRVHVTVEDRNPPLSWESAPPLDHSSAELECVSGGGKRGHSGGVVRAKPRIAYGDEWPRLVARAFTAEEAFVMSFLRHRQIYQSDLALD